MVKRKDILRMSVVLLSNHEYYSAISTGVLKPIYYKPTVTWLWLLYSNSELYNVELTVRKNWIFYYLRKCEVFTLTQTCEVKVELTVSKSCDPLFSLMTPFICSMGRVDPKVENPGKNTVLTLIIF